MEASSSGWLTENPRNPEFLSLKDPRPPAKSQGKPTSSKQSQSLKPATFCQSLTSQLNTTHTRTRRRIRCVSVKYKTEVNIPHLHMRLSIRLRLEQTSKIATCSIFTSTTTTGVVCRAIRNLTLLTFSSKMRRATSRLIL